MKLILLNKARKQKYTSNKNETQEFTIICPVEWETAGRYSTV
jgi:hypothetical protein